LPQRKGVRQRNKPLINQHSENPTPNRMAGGPHCRSLEPEASHTSLREELTKQLLLKDRKKTGESLQLLDETKTELLLKYQHHNWMLKE
jgi:hypothetical protein